LRLLNYEKMHQGSILYLLNRNAELFLQHVSKMNLNILDADHTIADENNNQLDIP
jgi:hypothetical protein